MAEMNSSGKTHGLLLRHFFRRFFDNDTLQVEGDTTTTIARALAATAMPSLLVAFFLQNQYPERSAWGRIEDQYFFVLLSFVVMGAVTIFEWEMLFPDRIDFLVLSPLPIRPRQMMTSKALALILFLLLFLIGTNLFGAIVFPSVCKVPFVPLFVAHTIAVLMAGFVSSCSVLVIVSLFRCCLPDRLFRLATPLLQAALTLALALLVIQYVRYGDSIKALLTTQAEVARLLPPLWFLGVYDHLLRGTSAAAFAAPFALRACYATGAGFLLALALYPLTWSRMHRMSIEGALGRTTAPSRALRSLVHLFVRRPQERAMFHFLGQTIRRTPRYQIYLAMYAGTGLSLAIACAFTLQLSDRSVVPRASLFGLHAVLPLLLFWTIAGLHTAFGFPATLAARWVFRVSGTDSRELVSGGWRWLCAVTMAVWAAALLLIASAPWGTRALAVQIVSSLCLGLLLNDVFFLSRRVPLILPRLPGRANFALYLTLYIGVLTPAIFGIIWMEQRMERSPRLLLPFVLATLVCHLGFRHILRQPMEAEEEMEGYDGEFQLLNLS